jgi:hypothetical protein
VRKLREKTPIADWAVADPRGSASLAGVSPGVVLMDVSYGSNSAVRPMRKDPKPRPLSVEPSALNLPKYVHNLTRLQRFVSLRASAVGEVEFADDEPVGPGLALPFAYR